MLRWLLKSWRRAVDKKTKALKLALEALRAAVPVNAKDSKIQLDAIFAIREALAEQPAQQPLTDADIERIYGDHHDKFGQPVDSKENGWAYERAIISAALGVKETK